MWEACGSPCSALKRPFGTFQCSDRLITEESPTGASFGKRSISSRLAASDNAGSLRLPLQGRQKKSEIPCKRGNLAEKTESVERDGFDAGGAVGKVGKLAFQQHALAHGGAGGAGGQQTA